MSDSSEPAKLNIGAVAEATGIPASTLRTWERRYGYPAPDRTDGGHRAYDPSVVERLELVAEALDKGHRAGRVVACSGEELRNLLDRDVESHHSQRRDRSKSESLSADDVGANHQSTPDEASPQTGGSLVDTHGEWLEDWLDATTDLDLGTLDWQFQEAWNRLGAIEFLKQRISPYLREVGLGWAEGRFEIAHEHHASEVLRDFLASKWRPLVEHTQEPTCLVGALPEERHVIGLHVAAVVLATAGWDIGMLGPDVPLDELVRAVEAQAPEALAIAVASSYGVERAREGLSRLVERLPEEVELLVGGAGAPKGLEGGHVFSDLDRLYEWALAYD